MRNRLLAMLVSVVLALGMMPAIALADEGDAKSYLALGDSISSGYGLEEGVGSFVDLFALENGLEADDSFAAPGMTSSDLLGLIANETLLAKIAEADVVTVTIGGNDVLAALYSYLANAYNAAYPDDDMTAERIQAVLMGDDIEAKAGLIAFASGQLDGFATSTEAAQALQGFSANLGTIVDVISATNPDVKLIIANQYNPYSHLANELAGTDYEDELAAISSAFDAGATALSAAIRVSAMSGDFVIADAFGTFAAASENPCNASLTVVSLYPPLFDLDLDFHPNEYGHNLLARTFTLALHPSASFPDVSPKEWYVDAIDWAVSNGILGGYGDTGLMGPDQELTRAQAAQILWNAAQKPAADVSVLDAFSDVDASAWYADALAWAVSNGLFSGYAGTSEMRPDDALSREQTAVVLMRLAALQGKDVSARADLSTFVDEEFVSDWSHDAMAWAVDAGVINGVEIELDTLALAPQSACIRAQMATILMNYATVA